jgi:Mn-dependent DtxR family transcriptional regulator
MSIDRDTFENANEAELGGLSVPDRVLAFLIANSDQAFEAREIARQLDVDQQAVSTALTRLKDRGLVEHKATYWAVTGDDDRLRSHAAFERATVLFNEQLGEESKEAWLEHAPDDAHPSTSGNG